VAALDGRVALVTGGGRGVGAAISRRLAAAGASVAVNFRRDDAAAKQTVVDIEDAGGRARAYQASVADSDACEAMVASVVDDFGYIDILVHNAGVASRGRAVSDTPEDEVVQLLRVHAVGPHVLSRLVLPSMRTRPRGDIVMISSVATRDWTINGAPYNMGKAAMEALAFTLAREERGNGVRVNVVAPSLIDTEMGRRLVKGAMGVDDITTLYDRFPFGRVCLPDDVAGAVAFLVADDGGYVSGSKLDVHGGLAPG
jgi:NAD(P)-dependent dehydrogenase (short-subunit alcohol dehydrogenase family)